MPETPQKTTEATASPRSSPSKKEIDAATMALNNFAQGKRHLVVGDIPSAINSLQEACKLLADQYGETAPECGDAYFCYGKALLEMARMESGVIGNALEGETEKGEVTDLVDEALEENYDDLEKKKEKDAKLVNGHEVKANGKVVNGESVKENGENMEEDKVKASKEENGEKMEEDKVESEEKKSEKSSEKPEPSSEGKPKHEGSTENEEDDSEADADAESQEGESPEGESQDEAAEGEGDGEGEAQEEEGEGDKTEEDEEEVTNLQLSWEMLELAKVIFQKQTETNPQMKKKVAEVYLKLGEVGLESENYAQGIEDFKQCLEIQKNILDSDNRCLAETHYQLGIAYSFGDEFDLAIESFKSAVDVLETRISNLFKIKKEKEDWTEEQRTKDAATRVDPFYTEQGEIDELNQLLPEMKEKIVDMEQMKKDSKERLKAAKEAMMSGLMGGGDSSGAGPSSASAFGAAASSSASAFGAPSSSASAFGAPSSSSSSKDAKPIMVVRKKRKLEEGEGGDDSKKIKGENANAVTAVNGSQTANG